MDLFNHRLTEVEKSRGEILARLDRAVEVMSLNNKEMAQLNTQIAISNLKHDRHDERIDILEGDNRGKVGAWSGVAGLLTAIGSAIVAIFHKGS